jgi:hypothetical protein
MAIPSQEIGYGTEEKLLWQISKQLESLTGATYNSKKTLLNVASGDNTGAKIETYSGAFTGTDSDTFLTIDLDQIQGGIIEFSSYCPDDGEGYAGTYLFGGKNDGGKFISSYLTDSGGGSININSNQDGTLVSFSCTLGGGSLIQLVYTVKLFTLPLYNA